MVCLEEIAAIANILKTAPASTVQLLHKIINDDPYTENHWSNEIGRPLGRSDMVVARCWQQWITEMYRRGGSNDREECNHYFGTNNVASMKRHLRHRPPRETIRKPKLA
ncbi:hypothetical protein TNCV_748161 [Trichonephila clavipes]|nr:hypothetical protein TNCV_748161 [Trichonephila clavipes]